MCNPSNQRCQARAVRGCVRAGGRLSRSGPGRGLQVARRSRFSSHHLIFAPRCRLDATDVRGWRCARCSCRASSAACWAAAGCSCRRSSRRAVLRLVATCSGPRPSWAPSLVLAALSEVDEVRAAHFLALLLGPVRSCRIAWRRGLCSLVLVRALAPPTRHRVASPFSGSWVRLPPRAPRKLRLTPSLTRPVGSGSCTHPRVA